MFWNSGPTKTYGRFLKAGALGADEAIILLDGGWNGFEDSLPGDETLAAMTPAEIAEHAGVNSETFVAALNNALRHWRVSPSRSMVNLIGDVEAPVTEMPMFRSLETQTRALAAAIEAGALLERSLQAVPDGKRDRVKVASDSYAMTASGEAAQAVNALCRAMKVWEARNRALVSTGRIKLPKALYRGIRHRDVKRPEGTEFPDGAEWNFRLCDIAAALSEAVRSQTLRETCRSDILSFTSNERVAELFSKGEGLVVAVDPAALSLVASWGTDPALDGADMVTNRHEREWIMRVGDYVPADVRDFDRHMLWSTGDPRGVALLDGYASAEYGKDGHRVEARFYWNSTGTGGSVRFRIDGKSSVSRAEAKKWHGFDPLPGPGDAMEVDYFRHEQFPSSRKKPYARWDMARAEEAAPAFR